MQQTFSALHAQQQHSPPLELQWKLFASLPDVDSKTNLGVAGSFSGITNHQLMVAGGANFPNEPAWKNGEKKYWDVIYVYDLKNGKWMPESYHLPQPIGYGASLTRKNGIICIGGKNSQGFLNTVSLLQWNEKDRAVQVKSFPQLPVPLASMAAAQIGDDIYIAGGENENGKHDRLYRLRMNRPSQGWQDLGRLPYGAISDAVLLSQLSGAQTCLYLIGGRRPATGSATTFFSNVYAFSPQTGKWSKRSNITVIGKSIGLAAGTGCAIGNHLIALFGGDDGVRFNQLAENKRLATSENDPAKRSYWQQQYDSLFTHHPGFNKTVFIYDTNTDEWNVAGRLPFPVQVTTNLVSTDGTILLPSGEIRPGIRTPAIWQLETAFDHS